MGPSDFSSGFIPDFTHCAYTDLYDGCGSVNPMRSLLFQQLLSQHPILHTPEGSSVLFHRFFTPSLAFAFTSQARLPLAPISGLTFRRRRIHLMLRAVDLLSFLRRLHRFITTSRPVAMDACRFAWLPVHYQDRTSTD